MQYTIVLASLAAVVAVLCVALPTQAVDPKNLYVLNSRICAAETNEDWDETRCDRCCVANEYDSGKSTRNVCRCTSAKRDVHKRGDTLMEKRNLLPDRIMVYESHPIEPEQYETVTLSPEQEEMVKRQYLDPKDGFYTKNSRICASETDEEWDNTRCNRCCIAKTYDEGKTYGNVCHCTAARTINFHEKDAIMKRRGGLLPDAVAISESRPIEPKDYTIQSTATQAPAPVDA